MSVSKNISQGKYDSDYELFKRDLLEEYDLEDHPKKDLLFMIAYRFGCEFMPAHHPQDKTNFERKKQDTVYYFFDSMAELLT